MGSILESKKSSERETGGGSGKNVNTKRKLILQGHEDRGSIAERREKCSQLRTAYVWGGKENSRRGRKLSTKKDDPRPNYKEGIDVTTED